MEVFAQKAAENIQDIMADTLFGFMQGEFDDLAGDFKNMLDRMVAEALAAQLGAAIFGANGAGGGLLDAAVGIGLGFLGKGGETQQMGMTFATGGSFTVGGSGGTDSSLVAFAATPGERVTVETPGQQNRNGSGQSVVVNMNVSGVQDEGSLKRSAGQLATQAGRATQLALRRNA